MEKNRQENLKCKFLPPVQKFAHLPHPHGRSWHCHGVHQVTQRQNKSCRVAADVVSGKSFSNKTKQRSCGNTGLPRNWDPGTPSPYTTALLCRDTGRGEGKSSPKCQHQIPTTSHSLTVTAPFPSSSSLPMQGSAARPNCSQGFDRDY